MKKSKILSLIMTMIMVCTLFISTQGVAKASDVPECVDDSDKYCERLYKDPFKKLDDESLWR